MIKEIISDKQLIPLLDNIVNDLSKKLSRKSFNDLTLFYDGV